MKPPFELFPEEQRWFSFNDYGAVLDVMARLSPKRVVEFGPGSSTLALIEGGAAHIDTCEDNPDWAAVWQERLVQRFPDIVTQHAYTFTDPLTIPALNRKRFDLALIDGPHGTLNRPVVLAWCLARCTAVLIPSEDVAYGRSALRPHIERLAQEHKRTIEWMETGPASGAFALLVKSERPQTDRTRDQHHARG